MSYAPSHFPALVKIITMTYRQTFHRLTEANLSHHDESHGKSQMAADEEKQTMKRFREEDDPYRRFLHTGDSPHSKGTSRKANKVRFPSRVVTSSLTELNKTRRTKLERGEALS